MLSLFPVAAYALEDAGSAAEDEAGIVLDASQSTENTEDDATADDATADDATADNATADDTAADDKAEADDKTADTEADEHDHDHDHDTETTGEEEKGLTLGDIISLAVLGVVIILVVIYCLTHKEKVGKIFRGIKSELKKIVWTPWNQVRKNTIVVLVIIVAAAIVIGVLDLLFSRGILTLGKIF
jgi:preprotein translocase SecE subunit